MAIHSQNWFMYKGQHYGVGTIVKIKWEPYGSRKAIEVCDGVAEFVGGATNGYLKFHGILPDGGRKGWISISSPPNERIEYIIKPVYVELEPVWQRALDNYAHADPNQKPDTLIGTLWYIVVMIGGAMFYDRWLIWVVATFIYIRYLISRYRD